MRIVALIFSAALLFSLGCTAPSAPSKAVARLPEAHDGKILVFIGGRTAHRGEYWIPENSTYPAAERLAQVDPPPRSVFVTSAGGKRKKYRVGKMTAEQKNRISIQHGDTVFFPYDRCWG
jgi:hypothetical protein